MKIVFLHPNFPGQFLNLSTHLASLPQHQVVFITARKEGQIPGVRKLLFTESEAPAEKTHFYVKNTERAVVQGQTVYQVAMGLRREGFMPDVIIGHSGWGATLFMKDLFPKAKLIGYFEWFNHSRNSDLDFNPSQSLSLDEQCSIRTSNIPILSDLYACDAGISPTNWQRSRFPREYQDKIHVIHDGIRTDYYTPALGTKLVLPRIGLDLSHAEEIITFVGRGMEPYRGFPQFMEAVSAVLKRRPHAHAVIVGVDRQAYGGPKAPGGKTYKEWMLEKYPYDMRRLHFTGLIPWAEYRIVLQASSAHVYLTYPFVLSWSALEAMSSGCLMIASATAPVQEVITHGHNGLLVDFFSSSHLVETLDEVLTNGTKYHRQRKHARETALGFDYHAMITKQVALLEEVRLQ